MNSSAAEFVARLRHPCYAEAFHSKVGRVHLPVAPKCNIHCRYCERRVGEFYHSLRPGIASRVIAPGEVVEYIGDALRSCPETGVVGVAGPGEPLFNEETFEALALARGAFPGLRLCVCTNGLLLPDSVGRLRGAGVEFVTVTINAVGPATAAAVYAQVRVDGHVHRDAAGAGLLVERQFAGVGAAVRAGIEVKVNSVLIPGVNDGDIPIVAERAASLGARVMNVMPLIPVGEFSGRRPPSCGELDRMRARCERHIPQFRLCKQCRADACGIPGLGGNLQ